MFDFAEFGYDFQTNRLVVGGEPMILHCHHYNCFLQRSIQDAEYIDSPQEHVVNQALLYLFSKDKDFREWLKANDKHDLAATAAATLAKGKRRGTNGSLLADDRETAGQ